MVRVKKSGVGQISTVPQCACIALVVFNGLCTACSTSLAQLPTSRFERSAADPSAFSELRRIVPAVDSLNKIPTDYYPLTPLAWARNESDQKILSELITKSSDTSEQIKSSRLLDLNAVNAPLDAVLFGLATETNNQLHVSGTLNQRVTLKVHQSTLVQLLDQLSVQAEFSWTIQDQLLTIWSGDAYGFSYPIDYLNMDRSTQSSVGLATQVGTINAADADNHSFANSSQTRVENTSEHRFWDSLEADMRNILEPHLSESLLADSAGTQAAARFSINREAGLLTLHAIPRVHQSVQRYLTRLHGSAQRQVLIEATVVEVALSDSFSAGVDWQLLAAGVNGLSAAQVLLGAPILGASNINRVVAPAGLVSLVHQGSKGDVSATLSLLEQFGDVRILSRPRIIALNNQSSVLKVVDNRVYFTTKVERSRSDTKDEVITETEIHTVPVGLVMNVTPQISASGSVMLNVRPTLSRILGFVNDPNPELAQANVRNGVPEIQVREMESMLLVQSGELAIIGGLMQETTEQNDSRLPGLGRIPWLGKLFSQHAHKRRQTELLIVLRPTVLPSSPWRPAHG